MIVFWFWLAGSLSIYAYRAYYKVTGRSKVDPSSGTESDDSTDEGELPRDSPERWTRLTDVTSAADHGETTSTSELPEASTTPDLPVTEIAARLEPVPDPGEIEPAVLAAMSPAERSRLSTAAASTSNDGGLFDLATSAEEQQGYDQAPLVDLLHGLSFPNELVPSVETAPTETHAAFCTSSASEGEVAAALAVELRRLGFVVTPLPPAGAMATRDGSAIEVLVSTEAQDGDDEQEQDSADRTEDKVTVDFTSL